MIPEFQQMVKEVARYLQLVVHFVIPVTKVTDWWEKVILSVLEEHGVLYNLSVKVSCSNCFLLYMCGMKSLY